MTVITSLHNFNVNCQEDFKTLAVIGEGPDKTIVQEADVAKKIRTGENQKLSPDDLVSTLQEERRKILTEIYGFDPLEATFGDYDFTFPTEPDDEIETVEVTTKSDTVNDKIDIEALEKRILRRLLLKQRLRRLRRAQLFGRRNPFVVKDIVGK